MSPDRTSFLENIDREAELAILGSKHGLTFMSMLIEICGANAQSFRFEDACDSAITMAFREGRRSVALQLLGLVHNRKDTEIAYHKAEEERNDARRRDIEFDQNREGQ